MNKSDYLARLRSAIQVLHNCAAVWHSTLLVHEVFQGTIAWEGDVEVFDLIGHPRAKRCYGWSDGEPENFIIFLESPPIQNPQDAVRVAVRIHMRRAGK